MFFHLTRTLQIGSYLGFLKVCFYLPIGLYLLCIYSIAYLFAFCNRQFVRNKQLFFVKKVEIGQNYHFPLYNTIEPVI